MSDDESYQMIRFLKSICIGNKDSSLTVEEIGRKARAELKKYGFKKGFKAF